VAFTTSESKVSDAKTLGADEVIVSTDDEQMSSQSKFDIIIDTVSGNHDANGYLHILKTDGALIMVGLPIKPLDIYAISLVHGRKSLAGSNIGGIRETQEMLDFCAEHNITADIELINIQQINEAFERLEKNDVKYRFVIDMASLKK
ncbi:MAG: zinc-binding dehydrogenase, partial [Tannerellaceae bacterium]|nr:zinc-binding dehydrogenase [Tannerellaceae bacterium]